VWATIGVVTALMLCELWVRVADVKPFITVPPSEIAGELADNPRFYLEQTWLTAWHTLVGVAVALVLAVAAGAVLAASRRLEWSAQPLLVLVMVTPWVAYITSVVAWLGRGTPTILFMVSFVTFPPLVFAAVQGMRSADLAAVEVLASVDTPRCGSPPGSVSPPPTSRRALRRRPTSVSARSGGGRPRASPPVTRSCGLRSCAPRSSACCCWSA
jgi:NitT/TauT family transport system permease protein